MHLVPGSTLNNTIVANSIEGGDLFGEFEGFNNLIEDGNDSGLGNTISGDPGLGELADNGGPTLTHTLLFASPAIDAGFDPAVPNGVITDQRGAARFIGEAVDIGAVENQDVIIVTTSLDEDDGTADPTFGNGTSLREAIAAADNIPGPDSIIFAAGLNAVTLTGRATSRPRDSGAGAQRTGSTQPVSDQAFVLPTRLARADA